MKRRPMNINFTDSEMDVLEALATKNGMTKTAVLRQALKLYRLVEARGGVLAGDDKRPEIIVL